MNIPILYSSVIFSIFTIFKKLIDCFFIIGIPITKGNVHFAHNVMNYTRHQCTNTVDQTMLPEIRLIIWTGSNTISNLMFSLFQFEVASQIGVKESLIVALQCIGGAAGNMICVHNVVAASATVGLLGKEGIIIRKALLPMLYYVVFAGILGLIVIYGIR